MPSGNNLRPKPRDLKTLGIPAASAGEQPNLQLSEPDQK